MAGIKIIASPDFPEQTAEIVTLLDSVLLGIRGRNQAPAERIELGASLESVDSLLGGLGSPRGVLAFLLTAGIVLGTLTSAPLRRGQGFH
jgi:hypothetical protein